MWGTYGATSQDFIQFILLVLGVICIPLMLFPKPIIEICCHKKAHPPTGSEAHLESIPAPVQNQPHEHLDSPERMLPPPNNAQPAVPPVPPAQLVPRSNASLANAQVHGPREVDSG